jgi:hypothetical protein
VQRHLPLLIAAGLGAIAIAVATAGCGGSGSPASSTAAEGRKLTRQEASLLAGALYRNYRTRGARFQAAALAGPPPGLLLRAWCALVGTGSAAAVVLARRV